MVLRVKPTPTRFPTNSLYTPIDNTPLHSISSVCPCSGYTRDVIMKKVTRTDNIDEETGLHTAFAHAEHYQVNGRIAQINIVLRTREAWVNVRKKIQLYFLQV